MNDTHTPCLLSPKAASHLLFVTIGIHAEAEFIDSYIPGGMSKAFKQWANPASKTLSPHALFMRLPILSPKITVIDFAHHAFGEPCPYPIYIDDEDVIAQDVLIIDKGHTANLMTNREMATKLGIPPTGSARIPNHGEPPETFIRNIALLPYGDSVADMQASIRDGFYLADCKEAVGDPSGEFDCLITEGYRIRDGIICEPIKGCIAWGGGEEFLSSISMVGDDFKWFEKVLASRKLAPQGLGAPSIMANLFIGQY